MIRFVKLAVVVAGVGLTLAGCSSSTKHAKLDPFAGKGSPYYTGKGPIPFGGGRYQVGKPYQVAGRWFAPKEQPNYDKEGTASWYGEAFHKRRTSNGEWFNMNQLTAAHRTLPFGTRLQLEHAGRRVVVTVTDRGPFDRNAQGNYRKELDLAEAAFAALAPLDRGVITVQAREVLR